MEIRLQTFYFFEISYAVIYMAADYRDYTQDSRANEY
jgi:hypothetical protein